MATRLHSKFPQVFRIQLSVNLEAHRLVLSHSESVSGKYWFVISIVTAAKSKERKSRLT